jgi:hypothetical protein
MPTKFIEAKATKVSQASILKQFVSVASQWRPCPQIPHFPSLLQNRRKRSSKIVDWCIAYQKDRAIQVHLIGKMILLIHALNTASVCVSF